MKEVFMNPKKVVKPRLIFWPQDDPNLFAHRLSGLRHVSEAQIVQTDFEFMLSVYPYMEKLFDTLFRKLSEDELPLYISGDYPAWVRKYIEQNLQKRRSK